MKPGKAVAKAVRESGIAQATLAADAGLSYAGIRAWLKGERVPQSESLRALARGLRNRAEKLNQLAVLLDATAEENT
jgi:transcriptional regulator with XRE-family HTH domain